MLSISSPASEASAIQVDDENRQPEAPERMKKSTKMRHGLTVTFTGVEDKTEGDKKYNVYNLSVAKEGASWTLQKRRVRRRRAGAAPRHGDPAAQVLGLPLLPDAPRQEDLGSFATLAHQLCELWAACSARLLSQSRPSCKSRDLSTPCAAPSSSSPRSPRRAPSRRPRACGRCPCDERKATRPSPRPPRQRRRRPPVRSRRTRRSARR